MEKKEQKNAKVATITDLTIGDVIWVYQKNPGLLGNFMVIFAADERIINHPKTFLTMCTDEFLSLFNPITGKLKEDGNFVVLFNGTSFELMLETLREYDTLKKQYEEDVSKSNPAKTDAYDPMTGCRCTRKDVSDFGPAFTGKSDTIGL